MRHILTLIISTIITISSFSQPKAKDLVKVGRFSFIATSMTSGKAGASLLDPPYAVSVKGDTLISDLPNKGLSPSTRADEGNLKFTSYHITKTTKDSKNAFIVTINIAVQNESAIYDFTIEKNGSASLLITNNLKNQITYNGYIRAL